MEKVVSDCSLTSIDAHLENYMSAIQLTLKEPVTERPLTIEERILLEARYNHLIAHKQKFSSILLINNKENEEQPDDKRQSLLNSYSREDGHVYSSVEQEIIDTAKRMRKGQ